MIGSWWFLWMAVMFVFLVPPLGYGWGYRGWGAPYPSYVQQRRHDAATANGGASDFNHRSWGWGGDAVWAFFLIGIIWCSWGVWWR